MVLGGSLLSAQTGDTIVVQTFTFDDPSPIGFSAPYQGTFKFPDSTESFQKILMYYTLKCDAKTTQDNFPCGEWDYLTYTVVVDSSGVMDSSARTAPRFAWVTGGAPDSLAYVTSPTWTYYQRLQRAVSYTDTLSMSQTTLGSADFTAGYVLPGGSRSAESQFIWRAVELASAGLVAGDISGLKLDISALGSNIRNLRIAISPTSFDSLSSDTYLSSGFTEVYFLETAMNTVGWQDFLFHTPFSWDGSSNLVIRFSFDQNDPGTDTQVQLSQTAFSSGSHVSGSDSYLDFNGSTDIVNLGEGPQISGSAARTIECWVYTESFNGGGVFQAGSTGTVAKDFSLRTMTTDNLWRVQLWGAPDFDVSVPGSKHAWRHFAVTYSSNMTRLYVDGQLVGQRGYQLQTGDADLFLGIWNGIRFDGKIDELRIWNVALNQTTLANWYQRQVTAAHPDYANLIGYYPMNEGAGTILQDAAGIQAPGVLLGLPSWKTRDSEALLLDRQGTFARPRAVFDQGEYTRLVTEVTSFDSVPNHAAQLVLYDNPSGPYIIRQDDPIQPSAPTDTLVVWEANRYSYVIDENGLPVDSVFVGAEQVRYRDDHRYFSNIVEYEILRFITPYGINLDLGPNGKTWIYDVTDYAPLLRDHVYLRAGNNQEVLDLKFVMIKGTPPRKVRKIENLWSGNFSYGALLSNSQGGPVTKVLDQGAHGYRIKTRSSGHGFGGPTNCAEFCPRDHYLDINGNRLFSWLVWNECATNHIYPQGGTWVYDRAGWCPGEEVTTFDHELTELFNPGDTLIIDYSLQNSSPPEGNFVLQGQLLTYGAASRQRDVEIEAILAPNRHDEYSRRNPICANPRILVRNLGEETVTAIDFTFGVIGGFSPCYYRWSGSLEFLENEEIMLPLFNWTGLDENDPRFYVEINSVNGGTDDNTSNDYLEVPFDVPPRWIIGSILEITTNAAASENRYQVINADDGTVVLDRKNLFPYTTYRDTLQLAAGCYLFHLIDEGPFGQDGLAWWANNDGNGSARLLNPNGTVSKVFNPDFGADIYEQFTVGWTAGKETPRVSCNANAVVESSLLHKSGSLTVFPNPNDGTCTVAVEWAVAAPGEILIYDQLGRLVRRETLPALLGHRLDLQLGLEPGLYLLVAKSGKEVMSKTLQVQ